MTTDLEIIKKTVKDFIIKRFLKSADAASLTYETPLISRGLIDSILTMQLVVFLETTYHIEFLAHEVDRDNLDTINIIAGFIEKKING